MSAPARGKAPGESQSAALGRLVNGFQVSQAIHVAATLGVADLLADGPATSDELAEQTATHAASLYRLLRALAGVGVLHEEDGRRFGLTPLGECLRSDAPQSLAGWAAYAGRPENWSAWGHLLHSVRTGENAFRDLHGMDVWEFRAGRPEEGAIFDRAMESLTGRLLTGLVASFDFGRFTTIADIGGGNGTLLAGVLSTNPATSGILFDQPHVAASAGRILEKAGVADRCEIVAGDFFAEVPEADAYVLKSILHDWEDAEAVAILRSCRHAIRPGGAVLLVERLVGPPNESPDAKLSDLNMLVNPGGRERTVDEFGELFAEAGFGVTGVTPIDFAFNVVEAEPVEA